VASECGRNVLNAGVRREVVQRPKCLSLLTQEFAGRERQGSEGGIPFADEEGAETGRQDAREPNGVGESQATAEHEKDPLGHRERLMRRAQTGSVTSIEKIVREVLRRLLVLGGDRHGMNTS